VNDNWNRSGSVQIDESQILLKQLPGLGRFGVVCASNQFDAVAANETCEQLGMGWAESYGAVPLQAIHLPWVHLLKSNSSTWFDVTAYGSGAALVPSPPNGSVANDESLSEFKRRVKLSNDCSNQMARTVVCASFECSSASMTRQERAARTGTPNDVQSLVQVQVPAIGATPTRECLAQLISPNWLISSAECLE
jgi:hypothetical protein